MVLGRPGAEIPNWQSSDHQQGWLLWYENAWSCCVLYKTQKFVTVNGHTNLSLSKSLESTFWKWICVLGAFSHVSCCFHIRGTWVCLHPAWITFISGQLLADFCIRTGDVFNPSAPETFDPTMFQVCHCQQSAVAQGETTMFQCEGIVVGRYVSVNFPSTKTDPLHVCEVEVYGFSGKYTGWRNENMILNQFESSNFLLNCSTQCSSCSFLCPSSCSSLSLCLFKPLAKPIFSRYTTFFRPR